MSGRRAISVAERRARLARRHRLAPEARVDDPLAAAEGVVALHATDPATVYLAALARMRSGSVADVERALYDERTLVRLLGMRRTMFVASVDVAGLVQAACSHDLARKQRRTYANLIGKGGAVPAGEVDAWLRDVEEGTLRALRARGEATGAELSRDEPRLRTAVLVSEGKAYEAKMNVTTWVLVLLALDGRIVRGRPKGSWLSSQYRWAPTEDWLPDGLPRHDTADARVELARRWLAAYGPATVADLRWWTGWTAAEVKKALAALAPVEVELAGGGTGLVLADDTDPAPAAEPWAVLLPALDPTPMGWSQRDWYLGPHRAALFDRSGNIGPTVWWDGRVVGGWAQRRDGAIAYRLLEDIGSDGVAAVETEAQRAAKWFGGAVPTPRFRTPLERELSG